MISTAPARSTPRRIRIRIVRVAGALVVVAAVAAAFSHQSPTSSPSTAAAPVGVPRSGSEGAAAGAPSSPLGEADGAVPAGTTVFDDGVPGVAKLDAGLRGALRRAATDAAPDGAVFRVDSGWRSPAYQEHLRQEAVSEYGSEAQAARWVATADTSPHVSGEAVDIGRAGAAWLSEHGAAYGLCRIYANEPWHYELRPEAIERGCPALYEDPTHDPRMQR